MKTQKRLSLTDVEQNGALAANVKKARRRMTTRSVTANTEKAERTELLSRVVNPVFSSGFLHWYEAENLSLASKGCRNVWVDQRDTYPDWKNLLHELNSMNCTNRCRSCEQVIHLKANRKCCPRQKWDFECSKRNPDFHGVIDIIMSSGVLTWREKGSVRRISKQCYKIHREQCTCRRSADDQTYLGPYVEHDPRYNCDYEKLSEFERCKALSKYTSWMIQNLHSFYDFRRVTHPSRLPYGLLGWAWFDIQMVTLQRACPRRYAFIMNTASLYIAQGELQRSPPTWYGTAFLGERHDPVHGSAYQESLGLGISEFCLPATDEVLVTFLRNKCYPPRESQVVLGPLIRKLSIFSPFMDMIPLDPSKQLQLPRSLEHMSDELIESMSLHFFCTIS